MSKETKMAVLRRMGGLILPIALLALYACAPSVIKQTASPALPPVDPGAVVTTEYKSVRLYFRVSGEEFIASELRRVDVKASESMDEAVARELIAGPDINSTELAPLISNITKIVSIDKKSGILFLTLSSDFLNPTMPMPYNWIEDMSLREAAEMEKRLAISSIVNTLTELGTCDRVLITVEPGPEHVSAPSEILSLFSSASDPLAYSDEYVLTPKRALEAVLYSVQQKDWERVARLCEGGETLSEEDIASQLLANGALVDYITGGDSTATDGATAVVTASIQLKGGDGLTRSRDDIAVRATRAQQVFKIDFSSLLRLFATEEGA